MKEPLELESVLQIAVSRERAAQSFYRELAGKVQDTASRDALLFLVEEERHHEKVLEDYRIERLTEWRRLLGLQPRYQPTDQASDWVRERAGRLVECMPASGPHLDQLVTQLGLSG